MMKTRSTFIFTTIMLVLLAVLTLTFPVSVAATGSTTLTTSVPTHFSLTLDIVGKGMVTVNAEKYTESNTIQIERNSSVVLQILPNDGYKVQSVIYNSKDVTDEVVEGTLSLPVMECDSKLCVIFAANPVIPETGDTHYDAIVMAVAGMVLSAMCVAVSLAFQKRKITKE